MVLSITCNHRNYYLMLYVNAIQMADLQLTEKVEKLPRCFQLRQVSSGKYHTFMVRLQANPLS